MAREVMIRSDPSLLARTREMSLPLALGTVWATCSQLQSSPVQSRPRAGGCERADITPSLLSGRILVRGEGEGGSGV